METISFNFLNWNLSRHPTHNEGLIKSFCEHDYPKSDDIISEQINSSQRRNCEEKIYAKFKENIIWSTNKIAIQLPPFTDGKPYGIIEFEKETIPTMGDLIGVIHQFYDVNPSAKLILSGKKYVYLSYLEIISSSRSLSVYELTIRTDKIHYKK